MKKIITTGCTIGGMLLCATFLMVMIGAGYEELVGLTILQIVYLIAMLFIILVYSMRNITETKNSERIVVKVQDDNKEKINYIVKNEDHYGI